MARSEINHMDLSTEKWLSEILEMDVPALCYQWPMMNSIDQSVNEDIFFNRFSSSDHESYPIHPSSSIKNKQLHEASQTSGVSLSQPIQLINNDKDSRLICTSRKSSSSPSPRIISFGAGTCNYPKHTVKTKSDKMMHLGTACYSYISPNSFNQEPSEALEYGVSSPFEKGFSGTPVRAQDHILAERKRRQKLSKHFAALSAVVPDLKKLSEIRRPKDFVVHLYNYKLDKASVLGGAVKHIKQLDKRVKFFEKEEKKRNHLEELLVSAMKKPRPNNDNSSSSAENVSNNSSCDRQSSSSVEVQVTSSGGDMLIKIECKNHEGILLGFSSLMKRIHLNITSSSFMQFGHGMLFIGAVAQVDEKFCVTAEFLANNIRQALLKLF